MRSGARSSTRGAHRVRSGEEKGGGPLRSIRVQDFGDYAFGLALPEASHWIERTELATALNRVPRIDDIEYFGSAGVARQRQDVSLVDVHKPEISIVLIAELGIQIFEIVLRRQGDMRIDRQNHYRFEFHHLSA